MPSPIGPFVGDSTACFASAWLAQHGALVEQVVLQRRVSEALDLADATICAVAANIGADQSSEPLADKVVVEAAMLLLAASRMPSCPRVVEAVEALAGRLALLARRPGVLASICVDPGTALERALPHLILTALGYREPDVDRWLRSCLGAEAVAAPERLPHRELEQAWIRRMIDAAGGSDDDEARRSVLGRTLSVLSGTRLDMYALTHAVMYVTDLGARRVVPPRDATLIAADATAALAHSLDAGDHDLTIELVMTWPMLHLPWNAAARWAFAAVSDVHDRFGFVPGLSFDPSRHDSLSDPDRTAYVHATSYHSTFVMGILCAAVLSSAVALAPPPCQHRHRSAGAAIVRLASERGCAGRVTHAIAILPPHEQDALSELALASVLRCAAMAGDVVTVRDALRLAVQHDLADGPAPRHAAQLLRRSLQLPSATREPASRSA